MFLTDKMEKPNGSEKRLSEKHLLINTLVNGYFGHMVPVISEQIVPLSMSDITS